MVQNSRQISVDTEAYMRTLTWTSPSGTRKRITLGGRRRQPLSSLRTTSMDSVEHFMEMQRQRVARRLHQTMERIVERRTDYMTYRQALRETVITSRG